MAQLGEASERYLAHFGFAAGLLHLFGREQRLQRHPDGSGVRRPLDVAIPFASDDDDRELLEILRLSVDQLTDLDVCGLDRLVGDVVHQPDALPLQNPQHADVRPAAGGAAAQGEADRQASAFP